MRLFISVPVPLPVATALWESLSDLRRRFPRARWVDPPRFHMTLKFLGETSVETTGALPLLLETVAARHPGFVVKLMGLGLFPMEKGAVLWAGVGEGEERLITLAAAVETQVHSLSIEAEQRSFHPHLTLARWAETPPLLPLLPTGEPKASFDVDRICLVQSLFRNGQVQHQIMKSFPLAKTGGVVLGVDWGRRRVGVAVSDERGRMATPLTTVEPKSLAGLAVVLADLARSRGSRTLVLGLPKHLNGSEGDSARTVRRLGALLESHELKVIYWDERFSSWEASSRLKSADRRPSKGAVDRAAAAIILQSFLDRRWQGL